MAILADGSAKSLHAFVTEHVEPGARVVTDGWTGYRGIDKLGYTHEPRSQRAARARGEDPGELLPAMHRVASLAKRWLLGTHQGSVDEAHLQSYLNEFGYLVRLAYYTNEVPDGRGPMPSSTLGFRNVAQLRLTLLRLDRRLRQQSATGLTPSQLSALSTIERHGPLRLGKLAARERISKSSVTRLVARLEAQGNINVRPDPTDGRSSCVGLTTPGKELLTASRQRADIYLARQTAALTPDEQQRLIGAMPVLERLLEVRA